MQKEMGDVHEIEEGSDQQRTESIVESWWAMRDVRSRHRWCGAKESRGRPAALRPPNLRQTSAIMISIHQTKSVRLSLTVTVWTALYSI